VPSPGIYTDDEGSRHAVFNDDSRAVWGSHVVFRKWSFGDGTTSTQKNPSHTYPALPKDKVYKVTLTLRDDRGFAATATERVDVLAEPPPDAMFYPEWVTGREYAFVDSSGASPGHHIVARKWTFGDGTTSTQINPHHTYASSSQDKQYTVRLTVHDEIGGIGTYSDVVYVSRDEPPTAGFHYDPDQTDSSTMHFTDESSDDSKIVAWSWTFGDPGSGSGNSSTEQNPSHTFTTTGDHTVSLVVTDDAGQHGNYQLTVPVP
jgi:PKD repeat protein